MVSAGVRLATLLVAAVVFIYCTAACQGRPAPATRPSVSGPVVYFQRKPAPGWQVMDWKGNAYGSIGSDHVGIPYQSPDGSRVEWSTQGVWQIVDRTGRILSRPDLSGRGFTWADDSSGLCVLKVISEDPPNGGAYQLVFQSAAGGSRAVARLNTNRGPNIAACSPSAGRIVITTVSGYKDPATESRRVTIGEFIVIDFATGSVLLRQSLPVGSASTEINDVIVSHDGALAALATATQTTIISLADGHAVARFGAVVPLAFSWDAKQLALWDQPGGRGEVLTFPGGKDIWSDDLPGRFAQGAAADPASSNILLFTTTGGLSDLLVISTNGLERTIATEVFPAQIAPCATCSAS